MDDDQDDIEVRGFKPLHSCIGSKSVSKYKVDKIFRPAGSAEEQVKSQEHNMRVLSKLKKKLRADKIIVPEKFLQKRMVVRLANHNKKHAKEFDWEVCDECPPITFVTLTKREIKSLTLPEDATDKVIDRRDFRYQQMAIKAASEPCPDGLCGVNILRLLKTKPLDSVQQDLDCKMLHLPEHDQWVVFGDELSIAAAIVLARRMTN